MMIAFSMAMLPAACALTLLPSRPERAASFLQAEGRQQGSEELLQLGDQVRQSPDAMKQVKQMISHMIAKHQAAQADDTDHKSFCDKEMIASKSKVEKLKNEIQKRNADQDMHTAKLAQLKDQISDLHSAISNAHKDRMKASQLREKEADGYKQSKSQWDQTLMELKRKFRSEIQAERQAAEKMEEELELKKVKAENKEEDAQFRYKDLDGEFAKAIARKTKEVEQKEHKVISMTHEVSLGDGDFKMAQEEMSAAVEYAEKIKTSCVVRQDPAKERKVAREHQIASMKEAYNILNGDDFAR